MYIVSLPCVNNSGSLITRNQMKYCEHYETKEVRWNVLMCSLYLAFSIKTRLRICGWNCEICYIK